MIPRTFIRLAMLAATGLLVAACGATGASPTVTDGGSPAGEGSTVDVTLQEWAVGAVPGTAPAGPVAFVVTNEGPDDVHEFVVIKTDLSFIDLPTDETGAVDESAQGIEVLGELEEIAVGSTDELELDLAAGTYALICNIYDETEQEAHYQEGMRAEFTVTE